MTTHIKANQMTTTPNSMSLDKQSGADERLLAKWREMFPSDNNSHVNGIQFAKAVLLEQAQPSAPANPNAMPSRQDVIDNFSFLEGLASEATYNKIVETAMNLMKVVATPADMPASDAASESRYSRGSDLVRRLMKAAAEDGEAGYSFSDNLFSGETKDLEYELCKLLERNAAAPKECATASSEPVSDEQIAEIAGVAREARRDLSHVEKYLERTSAPIEIRNRTVDVRNAIVEMRALLTASNAGKDTAVAIEAEQWEFGICKERQKPGGCQLHNLHCGYPACDKRKKRNIASTPAITPEK